jgi:hypothetical protein
VTDIEEKGMTVFLSPRVTAVVQAMAANFGCSPVEIVRLGIGLMDVARRALEEGSKLAVVTDSGKPLREITLPEVQAFKQLSIDEAVKQIIEDIHPSSLQRAISDLDPDNPTSKYKDTGRGR